MRWLGYGRGRGDENHKNWGRRWLSKGRETTVAFKRKTTLSKFEKLSLGINEINRMAYNRRENMGLFLMLQKRYIIVTHLKDPIWQINLHKTK